MAHLPAGIYFYVVSGKFPSSGGAGVVGGGSEGHKKKDNTSLTAPHQGQCCQPVINLVIDNKKWQTILDQVAKAIYKGSIASGAMHPQLYKETINTLIQATKEGGIDIADIDYTTPDANFLGYLKNHISLFSAAKNVAQLKQITALLIGEQGNLKPFAKFKEDVAAIFTTYNATYLQAEYNHALACAQMGAQWQEIKKDEQDFPYLKYTAAADDRVRPQHAALNGIVLPVNSPFWNTYYPPNGWNCRCDVIQLTQDQAQKRGIADEVEMGRIAKSIKAVNSPLFKQNVGKAKIIYQDNHPYFAAPSMKRPSQLKATQHYGMPTIDELYTEENRQKMPITPANPKIDSYQQLKEWWQQQQDEKGNILAATYTGAQAALSKELLKHMGNKKQIAEKRYSQIGAALETLKNPDEVWQQFHKPERQSEEVLTTLFIKYYQDQIIIVASKHINNQHQIETFFSSNIDEAEVGRKRVGILIKKK
ncbi:hypothetical protein C7N43_00375 [Sphingobacteriales bacterium UPWRP_1]|nr:hypothetical protein BVG80_15305 [Sphingobacteriales bacterium TSM_CSM]PSJ79114.1 hypothetical protein C7N43_00375 [Sphingobacteriales bacterium UPWRP_1]